MDASDFTRPSGELVRTLDGAFAFSPSALPPDLDFASVAPALLRATRAIGELKGTARRLANPYLLIPPLQRREALTSSAMEGTHTTVDELVLDEAGLSHSPSSETREVRNAVLAMQYAVGALRDYPISHRIIREAHRLLLGGVGSARGESKHPGEYRKTQNMIGGRNLKTARFVPPPPDEAQACMDELERYINRPDPEDDMLLIDLALVHYQFEAIHPFADGNGRIGRILITLMAMQSGLLDAPALYLSPHLEKCRDEYIDKLHSVSTQSLWEEWIAFFLERVEVACKETIEMIDKLTDLHERYRNQAQAIGRSARLLSIVDMLFEKPAFTIPQVQRQLGITYPAANGLVSKLIGAGILSEDDSSRPKRFIAHEITALSSSADSGHPSG